MRVEVNKDTQDKVITEFLFFLKKKREKKGYFSFNSIAEIYGKVAEEQFEVLQEFHKKK